MNKKNIKMKNTQWQQLYVVVNINPLIKKKLLLDSNMAADVLVR